MCKDINPLAQIMKNDIMNDYLHGEALYGDDFNEVQITEWYADEEEGYADLGSKKSASYIYEYHAFNVLNGFRHLPKKQFNHVCGFGSAYGDELLPVIHRIKKITIVDPSAAFVRESVHGVSATFIKPVPSGRLPVSDETYDLITCFGVLHHIPNVSFVVRELTRTLNKGGYIVIREPIVSMGDWRQPRKGCTKRERGIPMHILLKIVRECGLNVIKSTLCDFPAIPRVFRTHPYNSTIVTWLDAILCQVFYRNVNYHPRTLYQYLRPTSLFLVLQK